MATAKSPIPDGFRTVTPHMMVKDARKAIDFYKKAFGAEEVMCMPGPDGKGVMHAEVKIGDSMIMLGEDCAEHNQREKGWGSPDTFSGTTVSIALYVENADALFDRAVQAGAKVEMPMTDMFWGDRYGMVSDPSGHRWEIMTHKEDLTPDEIGQRAGAFFAEMAKGQACAK